MNNRGVSSVVGMILLIGVTATFMSLMGYYLIGSVDFSESPDARINIDESYDSVVFTVERNENVELIAVSNKNREIIGSEHGDSLELNKQSGEYLVIGYMDDNTDEVITTYYVSKYFSPREDIEWVNKNGDGKTVIVRTEYYNPYNTEREQEINLSVEGVGVVDSKNLKIQSGEYGSKNLIWNTNKYNVDSGNYTVSIISNNSKVSREVYIDNNNSNGNNGNGNNGNGNNGNGN